MTKKHMPALARSIKSYVSGSCELKDGETNSPYELKASKQDESKNAAGYVL